MRSILLLLAPLVLLAGCSKKSDDDLGELSLLVDYFDGDALVAVASSATMTSDRSIQFTLSNQSSAIDTVELTRVVGGTSITCAMNDDDEQVLFGFADWPASDTDYTVTARAGAQSRSFGPYDITVVAPGEVVNGEVTMGDQDYDINGYGPFFQSRHVEWGGGWTYANWTSILAEDLPRILDFATLVVGGQLTAVSPDDILTHYQPARLVNDCGYLTTTFVEYTGALDPEAGDLTLADVQGLPDPPATATSLPIAEGTRFVYRTAEGKKGLIKLVNLMDTGAGIYFGLHYGAEQ
jgi:hypothetical protein